MGKLGVHHTLLELLDLCLEQFGGFVVFIFDGLALALLELAEVARDALQFVNRIFKSFGFVKILYLDGSLLGGIKRFDCFHCTFVDV